MVKRIIIAIASAVVHAAVIIVTSVYWATSLAFSDEETPVVVPVELVTIAEKTNIAPTVQRDLPPPLPQPIALVTPPQVEVSAPPPPPEPLEVEPPPPEPETPPPPPPPPPPEKPPEAAPPPPPPLANLVLPKRKPQPPEKKPNFDVDSVLALLDKRTPRAPAPPAARLDDKSLKGIGAQNAMTIDVRDALLAQMRACWNVPVGAPNPEQLIVQVRVFLAQDGSLARPPVLESATRAAEASNPYMRTAAEAALRAINVCSPYKQLPADKYDSWREIVMIFDPSKMIGR